MSKALTRAIVIGTILQLAMVLIGHSVPAVARMFAPLGMSISLVAGLSYGLWAGAVSKGQSARDGAIAGGLCALIGIAVSCALGDVSAIILLAGTLSSTVTGVIGAFIARALPAARTA